MSAYDFTLTLNLTEEEYFTLRNEAARRGVNQNEMVLSLASSSLSGEIKKIRDSNERVYTQGAILSVMRGKLEEMPNLVAAFSQHAVKMERTAVIIADKMAEWENELEDV